MNKERVYVHEIIAFVLGASTPPSSNSWSERCCPRPCPLGTLTQPLLQLKSVKTKKRCKKCFKKIDIELRCTTILAVYNLLYYFRPVLPYLCITFRRFFNKNAVTRERSAIEIDERQNLQYIFIDPLLFFTRKN